MIKAGIIGSTGYAGAELAGLLLDHPEADVVWYGSRSYVGEEYSSIYRNMFRMVDAKCMDDNMEELAAQADVIFTATPQGLCASLINDGILEKAKVVDLSADFRIKDVKIYEKWYGLEHKSPGYIGEAVYGLCEINREDVRKARLVANPGCYTTCSILTLYPLVKEGLVDVSTIIIDAKSGTSGAGRGAKVPNLFCEVNESIKAYGIASHRHTPEIEEPGDPGHGLRLPHEAGFQRGGKGGLREILWERIFHPSSAGGSLPGDPLGGGQQLHGHQFQDRRADGPDHRRRRPGQSGEGGGRAGGPEYEPDVRASGGHGAWKSAHVSIGNCRTAKL